MVDTSNDRLLLLRAKAGDNNSLEILMENYKPIVNSIARGYFLNNGDYDDLVQEGMIGLHKAFLSYDINSNASFGTFAHLCITRQVQSAIRKSQSNKNLALSNYLSIDSNGRVVIGNEEDENGWFLESDISSPEDIVMKNESYNELNQQIKDKLSSLEFKVLALYLRGYSYRDIGEKIGKDERAVGNAILRLKGKLSFLKNNK